MFLPSDPIHEPGGNLGSNELEMPQSYSARAFQQLSCPSYGELQVSRKSFPWNPPGHSDSIVGSGQPSKVSASTRAPQCATLRAMAWLCYVLRTVGPLDFVTLD